MIQRVVRAHQGAQARASPVMSNAHRREAMGRNNSSKDIVAGVAERI